MPVGNPNRQVQGKAYSAKLVLKEGSVFLDEPYWAFQTKQGNEYIDLTPEQVKELLGADVPVRDIAGDLFSVETRVGEFENKPIHNVTLGLRDAERNEAYFVQFVSNNNLGRNIANRLLNLKAYTNVQLGLWGQFNKERGKTYPACSIRQGDVKDTIKTKYDPKTAPEMQAREFEGVGGKLTKDWTKVDAFLFAELAKLGEVLKATRPAKQQENNASTSAAPAPAPVTAGSNTDEDPPF